MARYSFLAGLLAICLWLDSPILAQATPEPGFEVVSIRPSAPNMHRWSYRVFPDRMSLTATAGVLVADAYGKEPRNIVGGPDWIKSEYYDVNATFNEAARAKLPMLPSRDQMNEILRMLQPVMAQRFGLKVHHEMREVPVFALVVAKGGPKFEPAPTTPTEEEIQLSGATYNGHMWTIRREPMSFVALQLSRIPEVGRNVVDRTGLSGDYTLNFDWSSKLNPDESVFTAVTDQLGLKLEPTKAQVDFLLIDAIERPSEN